MELNVSAPCVAELSQCQVSEYKWIWLKVKEESGTSSSYNGVITGMMVALKTLIPSLPGTDNINRAAFKQMCAHGFGFLFMPMTLNVEAVIFSYTTNMRAAVRTVCSSLASRPLYKPRMPYFLQRRVYQLLYQVHQLENSETLETHSLDSIQEQRDNVRQAPNHTTLPITFVLAELLRAHKTGYLLHLPGIFFKFQNATY